MIDRFSVVRRQFGCILVYFLNRKRDYTQRRMCPTCEKITPRASILFNFNRTLFQVNSFNYSIVNITIDACIISNLKLSSFMDLCSIAVS